MERPTPRFKLLSDNEAALFCEQMAMILKSGISSREGISLMLEDGSPDDKALLTFIADQMDSGSTFEQALEAADILPKYALRMIVLGEASGNLDDIMGSLAVYYHRETETARSIKNAVTYPLIMIAMLLAVIIILIVKVLPIFNDVYKQLGTEMTGISRGLLNFGYSLSSGSVFFISILIVVAVLILILGGTHKGRQHLKLFFAGFFLTRNLQYKRALGRFASALAMTLRGGFDNDQSLVLIKQIIDNDLLNTKIDDCRKKMADGENFGSALVSSGIFSGLHGRMVTIGYRTGSLDEAMTDISDALDADIEESTARSLSIIEPTLVAVLSIIVGMILLSVMLPLMGIMLNIG